MAEITAAAVKSLRDRTDLPMMQCKKALVEAGGDEEQAIAILAEKMRVKVKSRDDNEAKEGQIFIEAKEDGSELAVVELRCESEPVSKSEGFATLGHALVKQLLTGPGANEPSELLAQSDANGSLKDQFEDVNTKIQEKFDLARVARHTAPCGVYVHHNGKVAAVFCADAESGEADKAVLQDVAMHIAAMRPVATTVEDLPAESVAAERTRLTEEAKASGKPENIVEKIVEGQMRKYYKEDAGVLVEQAFAKDDSKSVGQVLKENGLKARHFDLFVIG